MSSAKRVSLSLPARVYQDLETLVDQRGYDNRSAAVADMLRQGFTDQRRMLPGAVMAGTISLFYNESKPGIAAYVKSITREYMTEVVASLHVMLEHDNCMEVLVVQGPVETLYELVDRLNTCRDIESGRLTLSSAVLPPLHAKHESTED